MATVRKTLMVVHGKQIPAKIYREQRRDVRASVGKKSVILRIPSWMDADLRKEQMIWFEDWIEKTFQKSPKLFSRFYGRQYEDCLLYTSPSPRDRTRSRMPSSA